MSDTDTTDREARSDGDPAPDGSSDRPDTAETTESDETTRRGERFRTAVNYLVLAGLGLTMLVAGVQFYASSMAAISRFVAAEFRPVVRAVFNLGLAVLAAAGVSIQLRRLR